ncbi:hypothetical protein D3C75_756460 [compost metagenome]
MLRPVAAAPADRKHDRIGRRASGNQAILGIGDPEIGQGGSFGFGCRHHGIDHRCRRQQAVNAEHNVDRARAVGLQHAPLHPGPGRIACGCSYAAENACRACIFFGDSRMLKRHGCHQSRAAFRRISPFRQLVLHIAHRIAALIISADVLVHGPLQPAHSPAVHRTRNTVRLSREFQQQMLLLPFQNQPRPDP